MSDINHSIPVQPIAEPKRKRRPPAGWNRLKGALRVRLTLTSGWRIAVQGCFTLISFIMGWQFYRFIEAVRSTQTESAPYRPPGVEGYLPISGLMGAIDWAYQGALNHIHPAATILFLTFVLISLLLRKAFCGWICPVGFISENLARLGTILFKRNILVPKWLDVPLRGIKYLLLGFFVWAIFSMSPETLHQFIASPYNTIVDVKMLLFFVELSAVGATILIVLALLSVVIQGFWCRYMCPYGALLGLVSWASPVRVRRNPITCTDCGICDKVCPARLPVMEKLSIRSVECIGCGDCVTSCPVPLALKIGTPERTFSAKRMALLIAVFFLIGYGAARIGGVWQSGLTPDDYRYHIDHMNDPEYGHPGRY